jgi:hypothetical protein
VNYAPVFHPGVTDIGAAATVVLGLSEERGSVDVTVQFVPTATISGIVSIQGGVLPPATRVTIVPAGPYTEMLAGAGLRGPSAQPGPDGAYVFAGIAPGAYTVKATTGQGGRGSVAYAGTVGFAEVTVAGRIWMRCDVLQPGITINDVPVRGAAGAGDVRTDVQADAAGSGGALLSSGGRVDAEGRFTFTGAVPDTAVRDAMTNPARA